MCPGLRVEAVLPQRLDVTKVAVIGLPPPMAGQGRDGRGSA
jgi:hypothetical protein